MDPSVRFIVSLLARTCSSELSRAFIVSTKSTQPRGGDAYIGVRWRARSRIGRTAHTRKDLVCRRSQCPPHRLADQHSGQTHVKHNEVLIR